MTEPVGRLLAKPVAVPSPLGEAQNALCREILEARGKSKRKRVWGIYSIRILSIVLLLGAWEIAAKVGIINPVLISNPVAVASALAKGLSSGSLWTPTVATFKAALLAAILGSTLGIIAGVVLFRNEPLYAGVRPLLTVLNSLPRPALAPIFILWLGLGMWAKVAVGVSVVFFMMLLNTIAGMATLDQDIHQLSSTLGMSKWQRLWLIELPNALPALVAGLRLSVVFSVLGVVVSEMVAAYTGLGQVMVQDSNSFDMAGTFAVLVLLAVLTTVLDQGVSLLQRRLESVRGLPTQGR